MNRRNFALSWGRKLFFGLSWPLTCVLGLIYLRSFILPQTGIDWLYYATTYIGLFGLLNVVVYFIAYCPVVLLLPSYYISRIWSLILILALNLFVLCDALSFASYHHHIYSYLFQLFVEKGFVYLLGSEAGLIILSVAFVAMAILIWLRGEMIWRYMQGRFSNPVKNWYLVLIVLCAVVSQLTYHYANIHPKLAAVFPLNYTFPRKELKVHHDNRKFFYSDDSLTCMSKNNPNIVFIIIKEWNKEQLSPEGMPVATHLKRHATSFNSHYGVSLDAEGGMFSLLYSIPSSYRSSVGETKSSFMKELESRNYETVLINSNTNNDPLAADEKVIAEFRSWISNRSGEEIQPYFLSLTFNQHAFETDKYINEVILTLQKEKLLPNTHILLTGAFAGTENDQIPFIHVTPDRRSGEFNGYTSQYDIMPNLMQRAWGCKKSFKVATIGKPYDDQKRDWLLVTGEDDFKIIDFKNNNVTFVKDGKIQDRPLNGAQGEPRHELIFEALKTMVTFSRAR